MTMEKTGDISAKTPHQCCGGQCDKDGQPLTKQAADEIQQDLSNDLTDAVASQTEKNAAEKK
jgi:hypothetical protein